MKIRPLKSPSKTNPIVKKYVKAARDAQHILPIDGSWKVQKTGSSKATKIFDSQREAINEARKIAINQASEVVIHSKSGEVRQKNSYRDNDLSSKS